MQNRNESKKHEVKRSHDINCDYNYIMTLGKINRLF